MRNQTTDALVQKLIMPLGEVIMHNKMPDDFELYLIALQIVDDDKNEIVDYLIFPVNPSSVMHIQKSFTAIKKTFNAVHVNENNTFIPNPISMSGNFGRGFKIIQAGNATVPIKTGYGCVKYLSKLMQISKQNNSNGRPYRTILYNLAFGDIWTVEINDCKFTQTDKEARIWHYDLTMTAVAPGDIGNSYFNSKLNSLLGYTVAIKTIKNIINMIGS